MMLKKNDPNVENNLLYASSLRLNQKIDFDLINNYINENKYNPNLGKLNYINYQNIIFYNIFFDSRPKGQRAGPGQITFDQTFGASNELKTSVKYDNFIVYNYDLLQFMMLLKSNRFNHLFFMNRDNMKNNINMPDLWKDYSPEKDCARIYPLFIFNDMNWNNVILFYKFFNLNLTGGLNNVKHKLSILQFSLSCYLNLIMLDDMGKINYYLNSNMMDVNKNTPYLNKNLYDKIKFGAKNDNDYSGNMDLSDDKIYHFENLQRNLQMHLQKYNFINSLLQILFEYIYCETSKIKLEFKINSLNNEIIKISDKNINLSKYGQRLAKRLITMNDDIPKLKSELLQFNDKLKFIQKDFENKYDKFIIKIPDNFISIIKNDPNNSLVILEYLFKNLHKFIKMKST